MANYIQTVELDLKEVIDNQFTVNANWRDNLIRLNCLEDIANQLRESETGTVPTDGVELDNFKRSPITERFIKALEVSEGLNSNSVESTHFISDQSEQEQSTEVSTPLMISKRGRYGGTWAHPLIALRFAAWLRPDLEVEIYNTFFKNKIIDTRDKSAKSFVKLNASYKAVSGEQAKMHHYINFANAIKTKLDIEDWDNTTEEQLKHRDKVEQTLTLMLDAGILKNYRDVITTIETMRIE